MKNAELLWSRCTRRIPVGNKVINLMFMNVGKDLVLFENYASEIYQKI